MIIIIIGDFVGILFVIWISCKTPGSYVVAQTKTLIVIAVGGRGNVIDSYQEVRIRGRSRLDT